jgi:putative redox protein
MPPKPPVVVEMEWTRELEFLAHITKHGHELVLDSSAKAGGSPVDLLAAALCGCMAMDVAYTLTRGRHLYRALRTRLVAQRSPELPHRMTAATIHFVISGDVPGAAVERAIQLSHEKYCSVWHSMRQDIELQVTFDVHR